MLYTVYTDWFPASAAAVIFDLEADRISSLSIDPIVESERGVVLSERRTGLENSPWRLSQSMQATAFQEHPYHWPVMGYEDEKIGTNKTWSVILKHTMHQITVLLSLVVLSKPKR
jgi:predicted Zn-dependent peptidase